MRLIIARIRREKLSGVNRKLFEHDVYKISAANALGSGREATIHEQYRGADIEVDLPIGCGWRTATGSAMITTGRKRSGERPYDPLRRASPDRDGVRLR